MKNSLLTGRDFWQNQVAGVGKEKIQKRNITRPPRTNGMKHKTERA